MSRALVAGGAGFLGSHLCERLLERGHEVLCIDDLSSGRTANIEHLESSPGFRLLVQDVCQPLAVTGHVDMIYDLASPASPPEYLRRPLETLAVGSEGTKRLLELAHDCGARFLLASTSEVYGDPEVHPQPEEYRGRVSPIGPRSVYDEAKRFAEALTMAFHRHHGADVAIVRIFNTYGPRLRAGDGRVVSNFICQALTGQPLTVYGDGSQTRSLCFVDDEIRGLLAMMDAQITGPVNIGNPDERTVSELAGKVIELTGSDSKISYEPLPTDDPTRRCPDITLARKALGWEPAVPLDEGLQQTIAWFVAEEGRLDD